MICECSKNQIDNILHSHGCRLQPTLANLMKLKRYLIQYIRFIFWLTLNNKFQSSIKIFRVAAFWKSVNAATMGMLETSCKSVWDANPPTLAKIWKLKTFKTKTPTTLRHSSKFVGKLTITLAILLTLASGLCEDHLVLICNIMTFLNFWPTITLT